MLTVGGETTVIIAKGGSSFTFHRLSSSGLTGTAGGFCIQKEIAQRQQTVDNLMKAIERGLNTEVAFPHIDELHLEIKTLEARLVACRPSGTIDRDKLIQRLTADAKRIDGDFMQRKAAIHEYVSKIIITDDSIEIQCIGDFCDNTGGVTQIRTGDEGFADPCLTTWL